MTAAQRVMDRPAGGASGGGSHDRSGHRPGAGGQPVAARAVGRVLLTDFRSYAQATIEPGPHPCVLVGPNGAGKTNVLEAVSFLVPGRGLRRARTVDVGRRDPAPVSSPASLPAGAGRAWAVAGRVLDGDDVTDLGTGTKAASPGMGTGADDAGDRRRVRINGEDVGQQAALADYLSVTWLTPQMDGLFTESPTARRRFLDRLVYAFDPAHAGRVAAYEHAMRERMRVLQSAKADAAWLDALEATVAEKGVAVAAARAALVQHLDAVCQASPDDAFPAASLALDGPVEAWLSAGPALAAEDSCRTQLAQNRSMDAVAGRAAFAPHRSDLVVTYAAKGQPASLCSTGEQKALLIGLVLAHADLIARTVGAPPVMLLDEVAAHLDEQRRGALFERLAALGCQYWVTGTDLRTFDPIRTAAAVFTVSDGAIRPAATPA